MKAIRATLIILGVLVTIFGGWELLTENRPASLVGLAFWMLGALVLHDGVLAGIIVLVNRLLRAFLSGTALVAAQAGLGIIATFTLIWVPVVLANGKVTQISALPLNYGANLIGVLLVSGLITVALVIFFSARKRKALAVEPPAPEVELKILAPEETRLELKQAEAAPLKRASWVLPTAAALAVVGAAALIFTLHQRRSN